MSLRQEELPYLDWIVESVKGMKEKWFFEYYPDYKNSYKEFKKDLETFRYASDEPVYYHEDKSGLKHEYSRPELLFIPLRRQYTKLRPIVEQALKYKEKFDQRAEIQRKRELAEDQRTLGRISQERFELLEANGFDKDKARIAAVMEGKKY